MVDDLVLFTKLPRFESNIESNHGGLVGQMDGQDC